MQITMPEAASSQLGLMACLSFVIGNIIGSGIFITPGQVLLFTGSIGLDTIVWIICGLFTILGAIVFVELGTGIPSDGGDYAYAVFVNWKSLAFAFMTIASFLSYPGANAIQCATFGQYLTVGLQTFVNPGKWVPLIEWGLGAFLLFCCTVVNIFPVGKGASMFQMVAVYAKALILFTVIAVGMYHLFVLGEHKNLDNPFKGSIVNSGSFALACYSALWSFAGWDILNAGAPSVKNPRRTLPLALIGGLVFVTVTYLLTNISFCVVLGVEDMKKSPAVAADFAMRSMGSLYHWVPFATALLLVSTVNGSIFALSRIMSKAAEEGHLPKFLAAHHKTYKTPIASLITQFFLCLLMSVFPITTIINYASVIMWGQKSLSVAALLKIRWSGMEVDRGVMRVPLGLTLLFFALSLLLTLFPAFTETEMFFAGFGAVILLACTYHFLHWIEKPDALISFDNRLAEIVCKVLNSELPPEKNTNARNNEDEGSLEEEQLLAL